MLEISSTSNPLFKKLVSLTESKGLKKENSFLLSGKNLVQEYFKHPVLALESEVFTEGMTPFSPIKNQVKLSPSLFKELDTLGTHSSILVLQQPEIPSWDFNKKPERGLHLLSPMGDPSNLGALARSAEAFGASSLILLKEAAHPFLPKAIKASAGSLTRISLFQGPSVKDLDDPQIWALDLKGKKLNDFKWPSACYLLVGEEGAGIPALSKFQRLSIPTQNVESLNATVAASIALYHYSQFSNK